MNNIELLRNKGFSLLDKHQYKELSLLLNKELKKCLDPNKESNLPLLMEVSGLYIDLGAESNNKKYINIGLKLITSNLEKLESIFSKSSIEYNIGNAYNSLYKIEARNRVGHDWYITPEIVKGNLFDAKQAYFKAYKNINLKKLDDFSIQVLTNLGNNLNHSGRIVEALQLFDLVLQKNSNFPPALISKADTLSFMISRTPSNTSVSLFAEIYQLFKNGLSQKINLPADIQKATDINFNHSISVLKSFNFNFATIDHEFELNRIEYESHDKEIKFYLDNFLGLSEHSLYCKCNGASKDDLMIGFSNLEVTSLKIVQLEHSLNRIKSEFSFARKQLFEFLTTYEEDNVLYQKFGVHKLMYGIQVEKIRLSFRMCFGIFDKIAQSILYLFELEKKDNENVYFESFWKKPNDPNNRWEKLNETKNMHITALYSIACDLSKHNGEFSYYKKWRNQLEHDFFSIIPNSEKFDEDILESDLFYHWTTIDDFKDKTLHLLQLVRSAIFSLTFACREELLKTNIKN